MFLSNPAKILRAGIVLVIVFAGAGCQQAPPDTDIATSERQSEFPFPVREPETFQAEVVVSTGGEEQKMFTARSGTRRRTDYYFGGGDQLSILETDKKYLVSYREKVFASEEPAAASGGDWADAPIDMLAPSEHFEFVKAGTEGGITKYVAKVDESDSSEVAIYFDESLGVPVKQEFFAVHGDERKLVYSVELKNARRDVEDAVFEIPPGFRQTSIEEFRKLTARR